MCKCTPEIKTPFCGKTGCEWPKQKLKTDYTAHPICPYCGHIEHDAWEIDFGPGLDGDAEMGCGSCGEDYHCSREVSVTYSTTVLTKKSSK